MNFREKHLQNIIKANNDNRLAIFIGAGISKSSENSTVKLPTWNDLIKNLKDDLGLPKEENDFLKIAQLYFLEFDEYIYYEKLKSYFPTSIEPSLVHKLIFDINPQCIITTNWDTILEKTIENNAYIYDVVLSDEDLVKSTLQKKLIKMHGDFKNHNIVFKEDDYLNYQYNFPIIENYIKSILSTHTILFLGYSYNDINLKQIMKWLQNHSKVSPPRYLISFKQNSTQEKYLNNHGITTIVLNNQDTRYSDLDKYSNKTATFLDLLINPSKIDSNQSDDEIINYVYEKLNILNSLDGVLLEQIRKLLTNCGFVYTDDNRILLEFYTTILTTDLDEEKRLIHKKFISILNKYEKDEYNHSHIEKIFYILVKANISGIIISDNTTNNKSYIDISQFISNQALQNFADTCFDFDFTASFERTNEIHRMAESAYQYYQIKKYEDAYNILEELIIICMRQRNYTQLFLSMFNRNLLLQRLKYSLIGNSREKFQSVKEYNLKEKFNNLPKDLQNALDPIYYFINFDYLYKYAFNTSSELKKKQEAQRTIENGGIIFHNNGTESSLKHINLISFLIQNKIMIDDYIEFKTINKYFVEISIIRQTQNDYISLNKFELYSCIKYIDNKELEPLFKKFYTHNSDKQYIFKITDENKEWLIEKVLPNLGSLFAKAQDISNNHEDHLKNVIFLLSLIKMNNEQLEKSMRMFLDIITEAKNTIDIYRTINKFLGVQYNLFKSEINDELLINFIEMIIKKLAYKTYKGYDYHAITSNSIDNLYGYAKESKAIFTNKSLVTRLILELKNITVKEKIDISQSLLLSLYDISSSDIQNEIKEFILNINLQEENQTENYLVFELLLIIKEFKTFDNKIISRLEQYMKQYEDGNLFSSILYTFQNQLDYLIKNMSYEQFKSILEKTNKAIEIYESRKHISIF